MANKKGSIAEKINWGGKNKKKKKKKKRESVLGKIGRQLGF